MAKHSIQKVKNDTFNGTKGVRLNLVFLGFARVPCSSTPPSVVRGAVGDHTCSGPR